MGLLLPIKLSSYYKRKKVDSIDCYLLSIGMFTTTIFLFIYLTTLRINPYLNMILYTTVILLYNTCWVLEANILLDILPSYLRSTGNSIMICVLHLIGDSLSPYWFAYFFKFIISNNFEAI